MGCSRYYLKCSVACIHVTVVSIYVVNQLKKQNDDEKSPHISLLIMTIDPGKFYEDYSILLMKAIVPQKF